MRWLLALIVQFASFAAMAQDTVHFPSFDASGGNPATELTSYLFKPSGTGPMPAAVFLHGCGGLISMATYRIVSREIDWAAKLNAQGIAVLMIDSLTPRGSGEICSRTGFKEWLYLRRPADAYGGLAWLQKQPWVAKDRVAMVGWSNGGGAVLFSLGKRHGRPAAFTGPDFRAAIAFYPGSCSEQRMGSDWTPAIPLMVLIGGKDVWTPAKPCKALVDGAIARGAPITWQLYPEAWHDFDWPNLKRKELTAYTTRDGVVPITGEDPEAHADAIRRVQGFLARHIALH
ncbi:MAG TPA: dienelactone hydrolase family protein [Reyranella sp.]